MSRCNTKFSGNANKEMYGLQLGELGVMLGSERVNIFLYLTLKIFMRSFKILNIFEDCTFKDPKGSQIQILKDPYLLRSLDPDIKRGLKLVITESFDVPFHRYGWWFPCKSSVFSPFPFSLLQLVQLLFVL